MVCSMTRSKVKATGHEPLKVGNSVIFNGYLLPIYNGGWQNRQMTTDSEIQYLKLFGAGFLMFVLVFVSRDFEVGSK